MNTKISCWLILGLIISQGCHHAEPMGWGTDTDTDSENPGGDSGEELIDFKGVDLLIVVDNSGSMLEEQAILATSMYSLINALTNPSAAQNTGDLPIDNLRIAVVSSDMGLQYGEGETQNSPPDIAGCGDRGDNGLFQGGENTVIYIGSGEISCDVDGEQCPPDFTCEDSLCIAPSGIDPYAVNCPSASTNDWDETNEDEFNEDLTTEVACRSALGTTGCGVEQQLVASVSSLSGSNQGVSEFLRDDHLLAVLVVSDEEDCSIKDPGLFDTPEWQSGGVYSNNDPSSGHLNTSCNLPASNEENYLFNVNTFHDQLIGLKGGIEGAVAFAAIVGVPNSNDSPCEGRGNEIGNCLDHQNMRLDEILFEYPNSSNQYYHYAPACVRVDGDAEVTTARPGRRYVKLAELFGENGYVYSICNADWTPAITSFSQVLFDAASNYTN